MPASARLASDDDDSRILQSHIGDTTLAAAPSLGTSDIATDIRDPPGDADFYTHGSETFGDVAPVVELLQDRKDHRRAGS